MLKLLDRYIIKKYLSTFFFVVLIFSAISSVIDFSEKIDDYIKQPCTKYQIIFDYTINFVLFINGLLFPIYALIAVIFFTSRMAEDSEMISILNAGASFRRILRPYLVAGGVITLMSLLMNHYVIPNGIKKKSDFERKYIYKTTDKGKKENVHLFIGNDQKAYIKFYRPSDSMMRDLRIETIKDGEVKAILEAEVAQWKGLPNRWELQNLKIRSFEGMKETLFVRREAKDTTLNILLEDFTFFADQKDRMTTFELLANINNEKKRGAFNPKNLEIELHRRTAEPFTIIILTILGLAIAGRKVRGGIGLQLALGIGLGAIFAFISKFSATFATANDIPALLGVWIPNIIFGTLCIYLVKNAQQ